MAIPVIRKKPGEKFPIGLRYGPQDCPAGVTALSTVPSVSPVGLTLGTSGVQAAGTEVYVWVTAGLTLADYTVRFKTTFSDTKILEDDYLVRVRN